MTLPSKYLKPSNISNQSCLQNSLLEPTKYNSTLLIKPPITTQSKSLTNSQLSTGNLKNNYLENLNLKSPNLKCALLETTKISTNVTPPKVHGKFTENARKRPLDYVENSEYKIVAPFQDLPEKKLKFSIEPVKILNKMPKIFLGHNCLPGKNSEDWEDDDDEHPVQSDDRIELLNRVNSCLIDRINFTHINGGKDLRKIENFKNLIERLANSTETAEFVLQVALYARRALNIRTAANYILAVAACHVNTKGLWFGNFFRTYFLNFFFKKKKNFF